jgi:hypothetical protein
MSTGAVRALRRLSVVVLSMAFPASIGTGCASCEAKCIGPQAEIVVSNDVADVKVCDASGTCTAERFDEPGSGTLRRSFTIAAVDFDGGIPLTVSGTVRTGRLIGPAQLLAHPEKGSCGCHLPARVFVDATGAQALSG